MVLCWWFQDWSYTRFCWRGQRYYAGVAEACDQLLLLREPIPREIRGKKLESLPAALGGLDVSRVFVDTNLVIVTVGGGLLTHHIIWKPAEDGAEWKLITASPESRRNRVIYTRAKPVSANPPPAANPATTLVVYTWPQRRGVAEAGRSAESHPQ
jgi:hypothetical protein